MKKLLLIAGILLGAWTAQAAYISAGAVGVSSNVNISLSGTNGVGVTSVDNSVIHTNSIPSANVTNLDLAVSIPTLAANGVLTNATKRSPAIYYVSTSGNDSTARANDPASPWGTVTGVVSAVSAAGSGRIILDAGTFSIPFNTQLAQLTNAFISGVSTAQTVLVTGVDSNTQPASVFQISDGCRVQDLSIIITQYVGGTTELAAGVKLGSFSLGGFQLWERVNVCSAGTAMNDSTDNATNLFRDCTFVGELRGYYENAIATDAKFQNCTVSVGGSRMNSGTFCRAFEWGQNSTLRAFNSTFSAVAGNSSTQAIAIACGANSVSTGVFSQGTVLLATNGANPGAAYLVKKTSVGVPPLFFDVTTSSQVMSTNLTGNYAKIITPTIGAFNFSNSSTLFIAPDGTNLMWVSGTTTGYVNCRFGAP